LALLLALLSACGKTGPPVRSRAAPQAPVADTSMPETPAPDDPAPDATTPDDPDEENPS
jgi:hypothetical protein